MAPLTAAIGKYPNTEPILNGTASVDGLEVDWVDVGPSINLAFRPMIREGAYDIAELGLTSYFTALDAGVPITALPIFPNRDFPHRSMQCNVEAGVSAPEDLEGRRVGARTYTVTSVVWGRAVLAQQYGVDLGRVTWVVVDHEHVEQFAWPDNVEYLPGADLPAMLASGEIAAGLSLPRSDAHGVRPLVGDADSAEREWFSTTGVYPINHVVVVRTALLQEDPSLAHKLLALFDDGARTALRSVLDGSSQGDQAEALRRRSGLVGPDLFPVGVDASRVTLQSMVDHSRSQRVLRSGGPIEDLFWPEALELT